MRTQKQPLIHCPLERFFQAGRKSFRVVLETFALPSRTTGFASLSPRSRPSLGSSILGSTGVEGGDAAISRFPVTGETVTVAWSGVAATTGLVATPASDDDGGARAGNGSEGWTPGKGNGRRVLPAGLFGVSGLVGFGFSFSLASASRIRRLDCWNLYTGPRTVRVTWDIVREMEGTSMKRHTC